MNWLSSKVGCKKGEEWHEKKEDWATEQAGIADAANFILWHQHLPKSKFKKQCCTLCLLEGQMCLLRQDHLTDSSHKSWTGMREQSNTSEAVVGLL